MRLLVIEDETALRESLVAQLKQQGFSLDSAANGRDGRFLATQETFDAIILDLGLPDVPGDVLIADIRAAKISTPLLVLTARDHWQEKVSSLEAGADDYVVKPFHFPELLARLNALIRRASGLSQPNIQLGPLSLNMATQRVELAGEAITLTAYEYKVLECLMRHAGQVMSKTALTEHVYDQDFDRDSNTIEVFIRRLRQKIDPTHRLNPIETLRGRGYRFCLK